MGLFGRKNRDEEIRRLDAAYQEARYGLLKEQARGYLIGWRNSVKQLGRFLGRKPVGYDDETYAFVIGSVVEECASFRYSHTEASPSLAAILCPLEDALEAHIKTLASGLGYANGNLEGAIITIAKGNRLDSIVMKWMSWRKVFGRASNLLRST